jgi:hypothetical protein
MATTTATSNDVFLAVLAMDAYNRGYLTGLKALSGTGIGTAHASLLTEGSMPGNR